MRVTHQTSTSFLTDNPRFNKLKGLPNEKFNEVFGDCFVSGFLEGGEFTAVVSIKVHRGRRREEVMAQAKIALGAPGSSHEVVMLARRGLQEQAEMAVAVNWVGGGCLKDG